MDYIELAEILAEGEKYVGTQGGGMDQAICLLGKKGNAVKIDFFPLKYTCVKFPEDCSVIVAHSMVKAQKTGNAMWQYNRRPIECRIATACMNAIRNLTSKPLNRLGDLRKDTYAKLTANGIEQLVNLTFTKDSYYMGDLQEILDISFREINQRFLTVKGNEIMPVPDEGFLLKQRAIHVLTEAERVEKSCLAIASGDSEAFWAAYERIPHKLQG